MTRRVEAHLLSSLREVVVVVFSILLAFALDSWWDGLQGARQARALSAAVVDELTGNGASLALSVERHQAIADAIEVARSNGSSEEVHGSAVIARELWEPRTAALEAYLSLQSRSDITDPDRRIRLGTTLELAQKYRERELRAAGFQDRARERIADMGLPISDLGARRLVFRDQVMLNYLQLRQTEELAAVEAGAQLSASIQGALEALATGP